jgi:conjugative transfer signal peptidase TraF
MKHRMTTLLTMFGSVALLASVICAKPVALYVWNASESAPPGLYRLQPVDTLFVTELVAVLPPEPLAAFLAEGSYLPRGVPMLKRVLALPGQTVCRNGLTITVDGIGLGEALDRDRRGRPLPIWQGCRVVARDDVFLMNWQSSDSLDGRYFGPIPASAIIARALPIWTPVCCSRSQIAAPRTHRIQAHSSFSARASRAAASRDRRSGTT